MAPQRDDPTWQTLEGVADVARSLYQLRSHDLAETLCEVATRVVGGDHASVTSIRSGRFTTIASTSHLPEMADKIQYATGQGPCLDAIRRHDTFLVNDLESDPRWPEFGAAAAAELGVKSMLAHVLPVDDEVLGALNVYATRADAFTPQHETLIAILGAAAVQAVAATRQLDKTTHLERALASNRRIGVALGIIMATQGVNIDAAWSLIAKASQDQNLRVADMAEHVIETGSLNHRP